MLMYYEMHPSNTFVMLGCGKTMLAKAVAHHTTASFIRVVGSEFVQKYLGEGARMVRDVFRLARENTPAIIFIDEIDAIATKRFDAQTGGWHSCRCLRQLDRHTHRQLDRHTDFHLFAPTLQITTSDFRNRYLS